MNKDAYKQKLYYSCKDVESQAWQAKAPIPPKIMFELTNICNHSCVFCANRNMQRKPGYMDFSLFQTIAQQARQAGVKEVALYTTGESLLYPKIAEAVKFSRELGFSYIYLTTNGVLLTPKMSATLLSAGLDSLRLSINAGTRDSYRKVHGHDDFEIVLSHLQEYNRLRKANGHEKQFLSVSCVLTNMTLNEKEHLKRLVEPHVDALKWTDVRVQGGNMPDMIRDLSTNENDQRNRLKPCGMLWNGMHVDYEGRLSLCCVDFNGDLLMGDIKKDGLLACWNSPAMLNQRRMHLEGDLAVDSLCYKCLTGSI